MKKYMTYMIPVGVTFLLVFIFVLLVGQKVYATNMEETRERHREEAESTYITEIKEMLDERGFTNCGVNMTKATNENSEWEYTVIIYHHSFAWMEQSEKTELENKMENLGSEVLGKISLTLLSR